MGVAVPVACIIFTTILRTIFVQLSCVTERPGWVEILALYTVNQRREHLIPHYTTTCTRTAEPQRYCRYSVFASTHGLSKVGTRARDDKGGRVRRFWKNGLKSEQHWSQTGCIVINTRCIGDRRQWVFWCKN